jgi:hypothetical protein
VLDGRGLSEAVVVGEGILYVDSPEADPPHG